MSKPIRQNPTPIKANRAAFLAAYAEVGIISEACKIAGIDRSTYYEWYKDILFQAQCEEAKKTAVENLENIARERASKGSGSKAVFALAFGMSRLD